MIPRFPILLLAFLFYSQFVCAQTEKVSICGEDHYHPVDIKGKLLGDSLKLTGIDTILIFRDWFGMNGFNGYGKVMWLDKGITKQYLIDFKNHINDYGIKSVNYSELEGDSTFYFYFNNSIDTVLSNPTKQVISSDHDGEYFVMFDVNTKIYCFHIGRTLAANTREHLRSQMVFKISHLIPKSPK
jgi:hypothetical protein